MDAIAEEPILADSIISECDDKQGGEGVEVPADPPAPIPKKKAKGAKETRVVRHHALRNSLLPVVTIIGLSLGGLLGGAVLTETVFGLAGVGRALFDAITGRDYAVVQGFTVVIAGGYVLVNLLVDLSYGYLDPRIRIK